ncbi:hypothetical protein [Helcococcus kunzii]|uniref:hypothetical protein n=1 Tax=Helcococcus kunzii TaxID=40091 RepID=UPI0038A1FDD5
MLSEQLQHIKAEFKTGLIDYEEAKEKLKPLVKEANNKSIELANKYNVKAKKISVSSLLR